MLKGLEEPASFEGLTKIIKVIVQNAWGVSISGLLPGGGHECGAAATSMASQRQTSTALVTATKHR